MNYLEIANDDKDKEIMREIVNMDFDVALSELQIENFILNDIEYPTAYGKHIQTKTELKKRVNELIDLYYEIKEDDIRIRQKARAKEAEEQSSQFNNGSFLSAELIQLEIEKITLRMESRKKRASSVLKELKIFYSIYNENPEFHEMSEEEAFPYDAEQWAQKTMNMPQVFEERYGAMYMTKALGKKTYDKYLEMRKEKLGLLPREIFNIKQLKGA